MIRVLIVDDQALVRAGFAVLIETADDLTVVGEAANGAEAVELAVSGRPEVILMDVRMPVLDGLQATARILAEPRIRAEKHPPRVLMLTTFDLDEHVFGALPAGASGFLLKDTPPTDLLTAIRVVASGDALLSPSITRHLIEEFVRRPPVGRAAADHRGLRERRGGAYSSSRFLSSLSHWASNSRSRRDCSVSIPLRNSGSSSGEDGRGKVRWIVPPSRGAGTGRPPTK